MRGAHEWEIRGGRGDEPPAPAARVRRADARRADVLAGRDGAQHRAARDRGGPRRSRPDRVGVDRVRAGHRRHGPAVGTAGGPVRPAPGPADRAGRVPRGIGGVRGGAVHGVAHRVPRRAGGAAAGCLTSSMFALTGDLFEPRERARYQGYSALIFAVSSVAGPLVGGFLTDHASWRWVFYVNLPLGLAAAAAVVLFLRLPRPRRRPRIDYPGIALLGAAVTCFTLLTIWAGTRYAWDSPEVAALA